MERRLCAKHGDPSSLYLLQRWRRVKKPQEELDAKRDPTKLAIGVEGGFNVDDDADYDVVKANFLRVYPAGIDVELLCEDLPMTGKADMFKMCEHELHVMEHGGGETERFSARGRTYHRDT